MPTSKKRKKRNPSRIRITRPAAPDEVFTIRQLPTDMPSTVIPGPGNRIGVHDEVNGVLHLPNAALFDRRLGLFATGLYPVLLAAGPRFPGSWEDLVNEQLDLELHPDDSPEELVAALEEMRDLGYLVPYTAADGDGWDLNVPTDAEDHAFSWEESEPRPAAAPAAVLTGAEDALPANVDKVHALLTARGWSVDDLGSPERNYPADGSDRPDAQNGWIYRPSFGAEAINWIPDVSPTELECRFDLGDWEDKTPASLVIRTAGNWEGCDDHDTVTHEFGLDDGDTVDLAEVAELLDELEPLARGLDPRALIECRFFGACGKEA